MPASEVVLSSAGRAKRPVDRDGVGVESSPVVQNREQNLVTGAEAALILAIQVARGDLRSSPEEALSAGVAAVGEIEAEALPNPERLRALLGEALLGRFAGAALEWLHEVGLLARLLPEVEATVGFAQEMGRRHKDVWKHTKQVVEQAPAEPEVRWAALLHDIGKVPTRALAEGGKVTFHGHAEAGARMFDRVARRLSFPKAEKAQIRFLILHHLRANQYDASWTDSAVRRFDREVSAHLDDLLALSRADITSARPEKRAHALSQIEELSGRIAALREIDERQPLLPSGLGLAIMERFGLSEGPEIGILRRELEAAIDAEELEPRREPDLYLGFLARRHPELAGAGATSSEDPSLENPEQGAGRFERG
jgi:poly(A) polymerase